MARNTRTATPTPTTDDKAAPVTPTDITPTDTPTPAPADDKAPVDTPDGPVTFDGTAVNVDVPPTGDDADKIVGFVIDAYRAADASGKAKIRKSWSDAMAAAVDKLDLDGAKWARRVSVAIADAGSAKADKAPVDYAAMIRSAVMDHLDAAYALATGVRPSDVPADADLPAIFADADDARDADGMTPAAYITRLGGILDALGVVRTDRSAAMASAKVGGPVTRAAKRDLAAHMDAVMVPGTFYTVAMIAKASSDAYGDDHPSSGAVAARLFPKVDGVAAPCTVTFDDGSHVIGIRKGDKVPGASGAVATADGGMRVKS